MFKKSGAESGAASTTGSIRPQKILYADPDAAKRAEDMAQQHEAYLYEDRHDVQPAPNKAASAQLQQTSTANSNTLLTSFEEIPPGVRKLWRNCGKIGIGGFGAVYRVAPRELMDKITDRELHALKLEKGSRKTAGKRPRLYAEIKFLQRVAKIAGTRHVVRLIRSSTNEPDGSAYIVMTLCDFEVGYLKSVAQRLSVPLVTWLTLQGLRALDHVHRSGLVHCDIKPQNMMLRTTTDRRVMRLMLVDFGLSKLYESKKTKKLLEEPDATRYRGTPLYGSLDTLKGYEPTPLDDVMSLFYVALELLWGGLPWQRRSKDPLANENLARLRKKIVLDRKQAVESLGDAEPKFLHPEDALLMHFMFQKDAITKDIIHIEMERVARAKERKERAIQERERERQEKERKEQEARDRAARETKQRLERERAAESREGKENKESAGEEKDERGSRETDKEAVAESLAAPPPEIMKEGTHEAAAASPRRRSKSQSPRRRSKSKSPERRSHKNEIEDEQKRHTQQKERPRQLHGLAALKHNLPKGTKYWLSEHIQNHDELFQKTAPKIPLIKRQRPPKRTDVPSHDVKHDFRREVCYQGVRSLHEAIMKHLNKRDLESLPDPGVWHVPLVNAKSSAPQSGDELHHGDADLFEEKLYIAWDRVADATTMVKPTWRQWAESIPKNFLRLYMHAFSDRKNWGLYDSHPNKINKPMLTEADKREIHDSDLTPNHCIDLPLYCKKVCQSVYQSDLQVDSAINNFEDGEEISSQTLVHSVKQTIEEYDMEKARQKRFLERNANSRGFDPKTKTSSALIMRSSSPPKEKETKQNLTPKAAAAAAAAAANKQRHRRGSLTLEEQDREVLICLERKPPAHTLAFDFGDTTKVSRCLREYQQEMEQTYFDTQLYDSFLDPKTRLPDAMLHPEPVIKSKGEYAGVTDTTAKKKNMTRNRQAFLLNTVETQYFRVDLEIKGFLLGRSTGTLPHTCLPGELEKRDELVARFEEEKRRNYQYAYRGLDTRDLLAEKFGVEFNFRNNSAAQQDLTVAGSSVLNADTLHLMFDSTDTAQQATNLACLKFWRESEKLHDDLLLEKTLKEIQNAGQNALKWVENKVGDNFFYQLEREVLGWFATYEQQKWVTAHEMLWDLALLEDADVQALVAEVWTADRAMKLTGGGATSGAAAVVESSFDPFLGGDHNNSAAASGTEHIDTKFGLRNHLWCLVREWMQDDVLRVSHCLKAFVQRFKSKLSDFGVAALEKKSERIESQRDWDLFSRGGAYHPHSRMHERQSDEALSFYKDVLHRIQQKYFLDQTSCGAIQMASRTKADTSPATYLFGKAVAQGRENPDHHAAVKKIQMLSYVHAAENTLESYLLAAGEAGTDKRLYHTIVAGIGRPPVLARQRAGAEGRAAAAHSLSYTTSSLRELLQKFTVFGLPKVCASKRKQLFAKNELRTDQFPRALEERDRSPSRSDVVQRPNKKMDAANEANKKAPLNASLSLKRKKIGDRLRMFEKFPKLHAPMHRLVKDFFAPEEKAGTATKRSDEHVSPQAEDDEDMLQDEKQAENRARLQAFLMKRRRSSGDGPALVSPRLATVKSDLAKAELAAEKHRNEAIRYLYGESAVVVEVAAGFDADPAEEPPLKRPRGTVTDEEDNKFLYSPSPDSGLPLPNPRESRVSSDQSFQYTPAARTDENRLATGNNKDKTFYLG
ncbi:unnamed protein product [Amoebophrya sp. A120]|nr:unnamed protein product [Amoebophrya sp. A120]|eukprot:GSA120T00016657001.1